MTNKAITEWVPSNDLGDSFLGLSIYQVKNIPKSEIQFRLGSVHIIFCIISHAVSTKLVDYDCCFLDINLVSYENRYDYIVLVSYLLLSSGVLIIELSRHAVAK